jgi:hypothetical protein
LPQDLERDQFRGGFGLQNQGFQGGGWEERPRFDQIRPNKRLFEDKDRLDREEQDLRAKLRREQEERKNREQGFQGNQKDDQWDNRGRNRGNQSLAEHCFNCDRPGHLRKNCTNPPFCYCCKKSGHRSATCPEKRGLRLCGFGLPGNGFYSIHIPAEKEVKKKEVLGVMSIKSGQAPVGVIETELRHLFREVPQWTIKKLTEEDSYLITFPSEDIRFQVAKFKSFEFETANIKAKVTPTEMSSESDGKLESVWVKEHKLPQIARKEEVVMEIAYLIGDPEEVDLSSLSGTGPVRMRVGCRDPNMIRGESQVFFNGECRIIRWEVEFAVPETSKSTSKFDRRRDREDDEEEEKEEEGEFFSDKNIEPSTQKTGKSTSASQIGKSGGYGNFKSQSLKGVQATQLLNIFAEDRDSCNKGWGATIAQTESEVSAGDKNSQIGGKANQSVEGCGEHELLKSKKAVVSIVQLGQKVVNPEEEGGELSEEELLDYEEDPFFKEKMEMETLEKNIEVRAEKLLKEDVIKIQSSKNVEGSNSEENMETDVNSDESMEIDWDRVGENLFSKEGG